MQKFICCYNKVFEANKVVELYKGIEGLDTSVGGLKMRYKYLANIKGSLDQTQEAFEDHIFTYSEYTEETYSLKEESIYRYANRGKLK